MLISLLTIPGKKGKWNRRKSPKKSDTIGLIYSAHVSYGARFYMRKLLLHTPGVESFDNLQIFESVQYNSYKETCIARGLLLDGQ